MQKRNCIKCGIKDGVRSQLGELCKECQQYYGYGNKGMSYSKIPQEDYEKAIGQFKMQVQALLACTYSMHGYQDYTVSVAQVIVTLAEQFGKRVRGKDSPIVLPRHIINRMKEVKDD